MPLGHGRQVPRVAVIVVVLAVVLLVGRLRFPDQGVKAATLRAGPSGRAGRAACRTMAIAVGALQQRRQARAAAAANGHTAAGQLSSFALRVASRD